MKNNIEQTVLEKYEPTIGLEIHVQLDTKSKMFCGCNNDSEGAEPNTNVCEICMGYPGTLPVANATAMEYGAKLAAAIGCKINQFQRFDRKNYFYPDLPKGYQVSQFFYPVGEHGKLAIDYLATDRKTKKQFEVGITRLHLEEDAGKLTHLIDATFVDLNRCGTPLAEIVTGPDIHSPEEARAFMQELQRIVRSLGVSRADMEKGHLRVDGNISVRVKGAKELGTKVEIKNMNSFKFLEQALAYEIERQIGLVEAGERIVQETRGWDEKTGTTISQRIKEGSVDYRYFPEPDLPPTVLTEAEVAVIEGAVGTVLPASLRATAERTGLAYDRVVELQDIGRLARFVELADGLAAPEATRLANMLVRNREFADASQAKSYLQAVAAHGLSAVAADKLYDVMQTGGDLDQLAAGLGGGDDEALKVAVQEVIDANPTEVARYKAGETKLIGVFVGQVMAKSGGAADPASARRLLEELLAGSE